MKCGREPNGRNPGFGVCPAALPNEFDGINNGRYSGRFCWNVAGTFCREEVQGSVAKKLENCKECGFYMMVSKEEEAQFISTVDEIKE
jgi:hypothetical protein